MKNLKLRLSMWTDKVPSRTFVKIDLVISLIGLAGWILLGIAQTNNIVLLVPIVIIVATTPVALVSRALWYRSVSREAVFPLDQAWWVADPPKALWVIDVLFVVTAAVWFALEVAVGSPVIAVAAALIGIAAALNLVNMTMAIRRLDACVVAPAAD